MSVDAGMFFAAGLGMRMRPLTNHLPKALVRVAGRALIDHALDHAEGLANKVVNIHHHGALMRRHLEARDVVFSDESERLLETGGGLRLALPLLGPEPVLTMNTDAIWSGPNPVEMLRIGWRPDEMDALLLLVDRGHARAHTGHGDFVLARDATISRGPGQVYTGAQIIRTDALAQIEDNAFSLNSLWDILLARGRVFGMTYSGAWCDVGRPEAIGVAEEMLREGEADSDA